MEKPAASNWTLKDGKISDSELPLFDPLTYKQIYDVFRVENGHPIFLQDHLERFFNGLQQSQIVVPFSLEELRNKLLQLIKESHALNGNIKVEVIFDPDKKQMQSWRAAFIPTNYPEPLMYEEGVDCSLLEMTRENPEVKMANPPLRQESDRLRKTQSVYETLLHSNGIITEGSRTNVFFIRKNELWTAPDHLVLPGTIRKKVLDIAQSISIPIYQYPVEVKELPKMDGAFITGTSPRVLPIRSIGHTTFKIPHPLTNLIMGKMEEVIRLIGD
ncbi:aminotransferase class IV [Geofilum rubicundum]|uniref:branched-chain-amino-acid transaminase n=1 Tax=Geofilum rubicundum JCM 15548 TaxID=1236989 RepID=A0A0E9M3A7_9BACT|nr:aminotransferase class IV [Geofilum rubicundum]GAO31891.1 branched-chain amino acid aminotransferase [Geofilum rubicundum JCM 15548]